MSSAVGFYSYSDVVLDGWWVKIVDSQFLFSKSNKFCSLLLKKGMYSPSGVSMGFRACSGSSRKIGA